MQETNYSRLEPYALEGENKAVKAFLINRYKSLAAAYTSGSLESVKDWVEPKLFSRLSADFQVLNEKNMKYEFDIEDLDTSFFNQHIFIGVNIKRSENFERSEYLDVLSEKEFNNEIVNASTSEKNNMHKITMFFHHEAPCNIIAGISMRVSNSIKIIQNGQVISEGKNHLLQFECEMLKTRSQGESFLTGEFHSMMKLLSSQNKSMIRDDWYLTDIDEALEGNPHTT